MLRTALEVEDMAKISVVLPGVSMAVVPVATIAGARSAAAA